MLSTAAQALSQSLKWKPKARKEMNIATADPKSQHPGELQCKTAQSKTVKRSTLQAVLLYSALLGDLSPQRGPATRVFLNRHSPRSLLHF